MQTGGDDVQGGSDSGTPSDAVDAPTDAAPDVPLVLPDIVRMIDIVDAQITGGPHADFPLLVSLNSQPWLRSMANGGDVKSDMAFDIYFSSDPTGTTKLAHDVERYDATNGTLVAWVKVPSLSAQSVLYIHYGDAALTSSQEMKTAVWSGGYEIVLHLDGGGDATGKTTTFDSQNLNSTNGKVGRARLWDGTTSYSDAGSATAIDDIFVTGGAIESWFYPTSAGEGGYGRLFHKNEWGLFVDDTNANQTLSFFHNCTGGNGYAQWHFGSSVVTPNAWNHVALQFDRDNAANTPTAVINGVEVAATNDDVVAGSYVSDASSSLYLGNNDVGSRTFDGALDEMRLSSSLRSTAWFATQYRNHNDPAAFYTVGAPL